MKHKIDSLIDILLDKSAREDERDDAAMDLAEYRDEKALKALLSIARDPSENETILDSCGASIAQILILEGEEDFKILESLSPISRTSAYSYIKDNIQ